MQKKKKINFIKKKKNKKKIWEHSILKSINFLNY
jgi:hypothetical protein